jgi:hypothetical protein
MFSCTMRPTSEPSGPDTTIVDLKIFLGRVSVSWVEPEASVTSNVLVMNWSSDVRRRAAFLSVV